MRERRITGRSICSVVVALALGGLVVTGCAKKNIQPDPVPPYKRSYSVYGKKYHPVDHARGYRERGLASWTGKEAQGRMTASGERYDFRALTCAHKTLPFGTILRVTNLGNNKTVLVRVNDRGPFKHGDGRIVDLSWSAANKLGLVEHGVSKVFVEALHK
ncbi:septal ring lytic transglycosylase RlpA family protein [Desulfoplanes sp.]